jgi:hypothetical protein
LPRTFESWTSSKEPWYVLWFCKGGLKT